MNGRGSGCDMDSEWYQYFFATEFVDMFPQTNGDILQHSILVWIGSRKLTSIWTYRATWRRLSYFPRGLKVRWTFTQRGPKWNGEWSTPEKEDAIMQAFRHFGII